MGKADYQSVTSFYLVEIMKSFLLFYMRLHSSIDKEMILEKRNILLEFAFVPKGLKCYPLVSPRGAPLSTTVLRRKNLGEAVRISCWE